MDANFWQACWTERRLGFHQSAPNRLLVEYWSTLDVASVAQVFVPLAGKSLDLRWLRELGHPVLAVELSPVAVREFFEEAGLEPRRSHEGAFDVWEAGGIRFLQGDFFDLRTEHLSGVRAVYDRAALVAMPPNMRLAYAKTLTKCLPHKVSTLLISMETMPSTTHGPPFSVVESEVRGLFEPAFHVAVLHRDPFAQTAPDAAARSNTAYLLTRGGDADDSA